jgi:hypothetical protein
MHVSEDLIAWAAGLYDGEGSASAYLPKDRKTHRRQMQVSQAGIIGRPPDVLARFREIVGVGNVTGPYRDYLYYWKTTRKDAIDEIVRALWPFLSAEKRRQFRAIDVLAKRPRKARPASIRRPRTEIAWAAGLFDGEGSMWIQRKPEYPKWRGVAMELPQSSANGIPECLRRFQRVVGVGTIRGPLAPRNRWSKLPQYRWSANGRHVISRLVVALWPYLSPVARRRIRELADLLDPNAERAMARDP